MITKLIEEEKYQQALILLQGKEDEESLYQSAVCFVGLEKYQDAIALFEKHRQNIKTNYYDFVSLAIASYLAVEQEEEAFKILEEELTMPYIPYKYLNYFNETYEAIMRKKRQTTKATNLYSALTNDELSDMFIHSNNHDELIALVIELKNRNVRLFLPLFRHLLKEIAKPRYIKALLLEILVEQGINEDFTLMNEGEKIEVNPSMMDVIVSDLVYGWFQKAFSNPLLDKNPGFLDYCNEVLAGYLGSIYPLTVEEEEVPLLAAAIHLYVWSLNDNEVDEKLVAQAYDVDPQKTLQLAEKIGLNLDFVS